MNPSNKKITFSIIILLGIITGIISGVVDIYTSFLILVLQSIIGIISLILIFVGIIKNNEITKYGTVTLISILLSFFVMEITSRIIDSYRENELSKITIEIEKSKYENG